MKNKKLGLPPTYAETKKHEAVRRWKLKGKTPAAVTQIRKAASIEENLKKGIHSFEAQEAKNDAIKQLWEDGKITSEEMFKRLDGKKK